MEGIVGIRLMSVSIDEEVGPYGGRMQIVEKHDIGWAVESMRKGFAVFRRGWNGNGQYLVLHPHPVDEHFLPWVSITTVDGDIVPWVCSQTDLLAEDWELADGRQSPVR